MHRNKGTLHLIFHVIMASDIARGKKAAIFGFFWGICEDNNNNKKVGTIL